MTPRLFILDTETTGLDTPHAWSVACLELQLSNNQLIVTDTKTLEFNPLKDMEPEAVKVHGRTDDSVAHLDPIDNLTPNMIISNYDPTTPVVIIGHNIAYDKKTLLNTANPALQQLLNNASYLCTKTLAVEALERTQRNRLVHLAEDLLGYTKQDLKKAHDALFDCQMVQALLNHILQGGNPTARRMTLNRLGFCHVQ